MNIFKNVFINILLFVVTLLHVTAQKSVVLDGSEDDHFLSRDVLYFFEDSVGESTIESLLTLEASDAPFTNSVTGPDFITSNPNTNYWFRTTITNSSTAQQHFVLESYNYRIDTIVFYETKNNQLLRTEKAGVTIPFYDRKITHKNLTFDFFLTPKETKSIYIKINNRHHTTVPLTVRKLTYFTGYSTIEYYFLGLFYGSILILIIINLLTSTILKSWAHFFYAVYLIFVSFFFMTQDGLGNQFVWSDVPFFNNNGSQISVCLILVFLILYTREFFATKLYQPLLNKIFTYYIIIRIILLIITILFFPQIRHFLYIDFIPFLLSFYAAYVSYKSGHPLAKYFLAAISMLIIGVSFNFLRFIDLIPSDIYTFYFINFCFLSEMIIFSYALAEKIRFYKRNSIVVNSLKQVIDDKDKTIEEFTYKTSHDILGPVKTILGLTNIALLNKDESCVPYIEKIHITAQKLESIIITISEINNIQSYEANKAPIDFNFILEKILSSDKIIANTKYVEFKVKRSNSNVLLLDYYLVYTLVYNLLQYNLTCIEYSKEKNIQLTILIEKNTVSIRCLNNGGAIPEEYHAKLFDLFYRISNQPADLGTCMKMVKICSDKLKGTIVIKNENHSTGFEISFPY